MFSSRSSYCTLALLLTLLNLACQNGSVSASVCETNKMEIEMRAHTDSMALTLSPSRFWLVNFRDRTQGQELEALNLKHSMIDETTFSVEVGADMDKQKVLNQLLESRNILNIEPDEVVESLDFEDSEIDVRAITPTQWSHLKIGTRDAWRITQGRPETVVAVIDSGVDFNHPDLRTQKWVNPREVKNGRDDDGNGFVDDIHGWDFVSNDGNPIPNSSAKSAHHGTHVAGIIAGAENQTKGLAGVSPRVRIMALRFLDDHKKGYTSNAIKAIHYAIDQGVKVMNLSWGSYNKNTALMKALDKAERHGVLVVAAAGNYGGNNDTKPFYPASYSNSNIISVTASGRSDAWVSGINFGRSSVDIAAPGVGILSTDRSNSYQSRGGSSMAAPFVAGAAALLLSKDHRLSAAQLKNLILSRASRNPSLESRVAKGRRLNVASVFQGFLQGDHEKVVSESENCGHSI